MSSIRYYESTLRMPLGAQLPVRSTLLRLKNGSHLLFSPIKFNDKQLEELRSLNIAALIAPNCFHHLYIKGASERLGVKTLYAAPGLNQKRPDVPWTAELDEQTWPFQEDVSLVILRSAPKFNECVFYHRDSKTLIVVDLFFNLKNLENNWPNFIFKIMGTFNRPACSRLLKFFVADKTSFRKELRQLLNFDFERIVMAHGEIIEKNAKQILSNALDERNLL